MSGRENFEPLDNGWGAAGCCEGAGIGVICWLDFHRNGRIRCLLLGLLLLLLLLELLLPPPLLLLLPAALHVLLPQAALLLLLSIMSMVRPQ